MMKVEETPRESFLTKFKGIQVAFTFRDVMILPGRAEVEPSEVDVTTRVTKSYGLNVPFVSSPMDTVTETEMAIALARQGGLGVIHRNCSVEEQVEMTKHVKRAEALIIRDVITVAPDDTVGTVLALMEKHAISGLPVVEGTRLAGIVTGRDVRFAQPSLLVKQVMTQNVVKANEGIGIDEAQQMLRDHKIEKLPIVNKAPPAPPPKKPPPPFPPKIIPLLVSVAIFPEFDTPKPPAPPAMEEPLPPPAPKIIPLLVSVLIAPKFAIPAPAAPPVKPEPPAPPRIVPLLVSVVIVPEFPTPAPPAKPEPPVPPLIVAPVALLNRSMV